jgi:hypothetical protein
MQKKYKTREKEWSIPVGDRIYCSHAGCNWWIAPKRINHENGSAKCMKCSHLTCITCRGVWHKGAECPQDAALQATINLAEMEGWKRCYSCHALVEHNRGCRHMTCRCKAEFCYICGLRWRTCGCSDEVRFSEFHFHRSSKTLLTYLTGLNKSSGGGTNSTTSSNSSHCSRSCSTSRRCRRRTPQRSTGRRFHASRRRTPSCRSRAGKTRS